MISKRPIHSVVLANYNGGQYLTEAIESVLQQEGQFELIIIDDGSTDGSRGIIDNYQKQEGERIRPIYFDENKGQGCGFNAGIQAAQGDIVSFIDSDDVWLPGKLAHVEAAFIAMPEAVLHHHNLYKLENEQRLSERVMDVMAYGDLASWWLRNQWCPPFRLRFAPTSGVSLRRAVLDRLGPCPPVKICADLWLTYGALALGPISASYQVFAGYRIHGGNNFCGKVFELEPFFYNKIVPELRARFGDLCVPDPIPVFVNQVTLPPKLLQRLVDCSPRKLWRMMTKSFKFGHRSDR